MQRKLNKIYFTRCDKYPDVGWEIIDENMLYKCNGKWKKNTSLVVNNIYVSEK